MATKTSIHIEADRVERLACSKCGHHLDLSGTEPFSIVHCPQCGTKQKAPMRLGSFLLLQELGKGGMGAVYRAYDETLSRYVAIKVMQKDFAEDKKSAENFLREARAAAALNHPHVVQIYSCGQEKKQLYIVMELVDGGRLDEMIEGGKALDEVFTLEVAVQVAQGLEAANDIGMVHGDIKPANILFDRQRRAKVVDFGLARFAAQQHLQPGEIWGTPYYIAPEKVRAQKEDQRADIYSLGATLYHVLAGQPPFDGETAKDVVLARLKSPALSLRSVRPSLQPETAEVIARTLEPEPSRRYPTYKSLLADLNEALRVARQREGLPPVSAKRSSAKRVLLAVVLLALVAGIAMMVVRDGQDPEVTPTVVPGPVADPTPPPAPVPDERPAIPDVELAVQPFDDDAQERIAAAVKGWEEDRESTYINELGALFSAMPRLGVERPWVGVLQAVPAWVRGDTTAMLRHLRGVQDAQLRELEDDQPHPGIMPQTLARFMVGRVDQDAVQAVAEDWPSWFGDLALFLFGMEQVRQGDAESARDALRRYRDLEPDDVAWPYVFRAFAGRYVDQIDQWLAERDRQRNADGAAAVRALRAYRGGAPAWLRDSVDQEIQAAEARIAEAEAALAAAEREEREARIAADRERVEAMRSDFFPLVQSRDFRRAITQSRERASQLETPEGRTQLDLLVESYERMDQLRRFIINGIQEDPITQAVAPELGGDAVSATLSGIRVSLGGHGSMVRPWNQVGPRLMATLAEHYIARAPEEERAELTLSLAVFAYQTRGLRPAKIYADRAIQLDADLADHARALMPELDWD